VLHAGYPGKVLPAQRALDQLHSAALTLRCTENLNTPRVKCKAKFPGASDGYVENYYYRLPFLLGLISALQNSFVLYCKSQIPLR